MVVFTCNHCGESVKKTSVEKHYSGKCRRAPVNVSCMDCMKDFHGTEYVAHTKCITEAEKYSGKDYVPKDPKNSGEKKQESWMDTVRSILTTSEYNLTNAVRGAFQRLEAFDNVPRKKAKFENFIKNCFRLKPDEATQVWSILEKEIVKTKIANAKLTQDAKNKKLTNGDTKRVDNSSIATNEEKEDKNDDAVLEKDAIQKEDKKSRKRQLEDDKMTAVESIEEPAKKKKIKKSHLNEENTIPVVESVVSVEVPVKKNKSKKNKLNEENTSPVKESVEFIEEPITKIDVNESEESTTNATNGCIQSPKVSQSNIEVNGNNSVNAKQFEWCSEILKIIAKKTDGIPIDKLKHKVLKKYFKKTEIVISSEKQERKLNKTFLKYLKKCYLNLENNVVRSF